VRRVLLSLFLAPSTTKRKQQSNLPKLTTHPTQSHPSTQREKQGKKPPSRESKLLFACFVVVLITWMSFASGERELRGGVLSMLETHIMMSSLMSASVLFSYSASLILSCFVSHFLTCFALHFFLCFASVRSRIYPSLIWFWSIREPLYA
jgi:flagellar biosynthesis protein FlhB